jgi:hypothetical protein
MALPRLGHGTSKIRENDVHEWSTFLCLRSAPTRSGEQQSITTSDAGVFPRKTQILVVIAALGILLLLTFRAKHISEGELQVAVASSYPVRATNLVEERGYAGPLYNHLDWGGYLIWRLPYLPEGRPGIAQSYAFQGQSTIS